jgi:hypothetical protein
MAIEIRCPGCSRTLRVPDEHAGKQVRCPACQQICVAPAAFGSASAAADPAGVTADDATWHLRTENGPTYGPIAWSQVRSWAGEGRITAGSQLASDADGRWQPATEFFPELRRSAAPAPAPTPQTYPWTSEQVAERSGVARGYVNPHRGGLILVLGLLGFIVTCPIFSLMAWVMGSHDLAEMRAGRMDRSGEGLTQAGQILGMVIGGFCILGAAVGLFLFAVVAIAGKF